MRVRFLVSFIPPRPCSIPISHPPPPLFLPQALALALALDKEKGLDVEKQGLQAMLDAPAVKAELGRRNLSFQLDLVMAYLRRVHFVVFYGGDEFKDEGDLLFSAVSFLDSLSPSYPFLTCLLPCVPRPLAPSCPIFKFIYSLAFNCHITLNQCSRSCTSVWNLTSPPRRPSSPPPRKGGRRQVRVNNFVGSKQENGWWRN